MPQNRFVRKRSLAFAFVLLIIAAIPIIAVFRASPTNSDPSYPPLTGKFIYIEAAGSGLWQIDANGENNIRLADAPSANSLALSPDETMLAFASPRPDENGNNLFIMDIDGKNLHPVRKPQTLSQGGEIEVSWSLDGTRLFYISQREADSWVFKLHSIHPDGRDEKTIAFDTFDTAAQFSYPVASWSSDGKTILFRGQTTEGGDFQVSLYKSDGTLSHVLYTGDAMEFGPTAWSRDGTQLAYTIRKYETSALTTLFITDAEGLNIQTIDLNVDVMSDLTWSPDNRQIAFWGYGYETGLKKGLFIMNVDGSNLHSLPIDGFGLVWFKDTPSAAG